MATNPNPDLRRVDDVRVKPSVFPKVSLKVMPTENTSWVIDDDGKAERKTVQLNHATRRAMVLDYNRRIRHTIRHPKTAMGPVEA